jgi:lipopolysaccharide transport system permease protein
MNYQSSAKVPLWRAGAALVTEHSDLIRSLVSRELTNRYKGSLVGISWSVITPAVMIVIFTLIFSGIFQARFGKTGGHLSFAVYLFCGLLPWIAFSDGIQRATTVLTENVNLIKRVVFPVEALPVNVVLAAVVQQLLGTIVLLLAAFALTRTFHATALLLPVLLVPQLIATLGLAWLMASLGVFLRDMAQFNQLFFLGWMYLTPIFYPEEQIPSKYRWLVEINPMAPLIRSYRRILLEGEMPDWKGLLFTSAFALACFLFGYWWFERTKKAFADVI